MITGSVGRPRRIDQIIPSIVEHDAVSNHAFSAQRLLREMGFVSEIYAQIIGPGADGRVIPIAELPRITDGGQWVLYQCSIGSPVAEIFATHPGRKLLDYHNITPGELVERWLPPLGEETRLGRAQLRRLAAVVDYAFADSPFNAAELVALGYRTAEVVPVLVEAGNLTATPDSSAVDRLTAKKAVGGADWLFVGQVAPHKAQHDIVKAFACYRKVYDPSARLYLVGREMGYAYREAVRRFAGELGLAEAVSLVGSVTTGVLAAHYATADVFVCLSDHEGFCAPVVESMTRGLPVVAYGVAALPGTIGNGGLVLGRKDPAYVAAVVHELLRDERRRSELVAAGRSRGATFTLANAEVAFRSAITASLELG